MTLSILIDQFIHLRGSEVAVAVAAGVVDLLMPFLRICSTDFARDICDRLFLFDFI